jgi:chromosome segregation ATPase
MREAAVSLFLMAMLLVPKAGAAQTPAAARPPTAPATPATRAPLATPADAPDAAPATPGESPELIRELARLNATLTRISELLERQVARQDADLLLRHLASKNDDLAPLRAELSDARARKTAADEERQRLELGLKDVKDRIEAGDDSVTGRTPEELAEAIKGWESGLRVAKARQETAAEQTAQIEQRLAFESADYDALRAEVERLIEQIRHPRP